MAKPKTHQERTLIIDWIIEMVKQYGHATTKDIAAMFGLHRTTAEKYIRQRAEQVAKKMQIDFRGLTLRQQKSRWGSCSSRGNLNFNWRLVHYPPQIIDYVIIHELAHRREMNHSAAFWRLVGHYDSEYKQHRQELAKKRYNEHYDFNLPRR